MAQASTSWNPGLITVTNQLPDLRERDPLAMEFILSKIYASKLIIIIFQLIHCPHPYNDYNNDIIEEFIENEKYERTHSTQVYPESSGEPARNPTLRHQTNGPKEPISILLMKLLLLSRIDLLRRILSVLERDIETLLRLAENQERQSDRMEQNNEDLSMRMGHMKKNLQLRTVQLNELQRRVDSTQLASADGTFVWNVNQVMPWKTHTYSYSIGFYS